MSGTGRGMLTIFILFIAANTVATKGPAMVKFTNFKGMWTVNPHINPEYKWLPVAYSNVPGKEMHGGLLELKKGDDFTFTQWYNGFLYILQGDMEIKDLGAMVDLKATAGDIFKISMGTKVTFKHTDKMQKIVRAYWVATLPGPAASFFLNSQIKQQPKVYFMKNMPARVGKLPLFVNVQKSLSYLEDFLLIEEQGRELSAGLYELRKGPALDYTYEYEEFKYIVTGQFDLTDGTGQKVSAKAGDLIYFPKGCAVNFKSGVDVSMGLYVGQRTGGTA